MTRLLSASAVAAVVCARADGWPAADECCAALRQVSSESLRVNLIPTEQLAQIYERRLRNPKAASPPVLGADRLLADLAGFKGARVQMLAWERAGRVFCVLLDETATQLVACFVGTDRRLMSPAPVESLN